MPHYLQFIYGIYVTLYLSCFTQFRMHSWPFFFYRFKASHQGRGNEWCGREGSEKEKSSFRERFGTEKSSFLPFDTPKIARYTSYAQLY